MPFDKHRGFLLIGPHTNSAEETGGRGGEKREGRYTFSNQRSVYVLITLIQPNNWYWSAAKAKHEQKVDKFARREVFLQRRDGKEEGRVETGGRLRSKSLRGPRRIDPITSCSPGNSIYLLFHFCWHYYWKMIANDVARVLTHAHWDLVMAATGYVKPGSC